MWLKQLSKRWLPRWVAGTESSKPRRQAAPRRGLRLTLEPLEDRTVPSSFTAASVSDLIADINAANRAGGSNTITLVAPATSPYVLTAANNTTDGATGLPVTAAGDNLTIVGNGDTISRSSAAGTPAFRLFDVAAGASLTLQNLTLQGGLAFGAGVSADGGAIYNQGTLDMNGVTVQNNVAQGQYGAAGQTGQSAAGGGIYSSGSLTLEGGTLVQNNQALGGRGGDQSYSAYPGRGGDGLGGGLYLSSGTANLIGAILSSNTARGGVGGLGYNYGISRGQSRAPSGNSFGGGFYAGGGTVLLRSTNVTGNVAQAGYRGSVGVGEGGGLYIDALAAVCLDAFTQAHVTNNAATTLDPNIHGPYTVCP